MLFLISTLTDKHLLTLLLLFPMPEKAVHLNPRPQLKDSKPSTKAKFGASCESCRRYLQDLPNRFCSIACKVSAGSVKSRGEEQKVMNFSIGEFQKMSWEEEEEEERVQSSGGLSNSSPLNSRIHLSSPFSSKPNGGLSQLLPKPKQNCSSYHPFPKGNSSCYAVAARQYSFKPSSGLGEKMANVNFAKKLFEKPSKAFTSTFSKYRAAIGLQIDAFWKRNLLFLIGVGGVALCALLWRIMFGIANTFVGVSEGMAKYGFLALSSAIVAFAGLYMRSRITINPDRVYRIAMRKLNTSAGILEVMGAPLTGTELRAYVMSGGGITLKNFKAKLRSKRCFLIFPIQGSERKGLVSVEVKKKKGQYDMKLLAVDIPMASGPDQRLFIIGDEDEYKIGGGLIAELRDPVVKAMAASKEFDDLDQIEEEEDAEKELQEAERKHRDEIEKLERENGCNN